MKEIEVVAAIIENEGEILCVQRGENKYDYISKKYEFPGGKVEKGESKMDALRREILEELHMEVSIRTEFITVNHQYPDFKLVMHSFFCNSNDRVLTLTEHVDFKWLKKDALEHLDWAAADIPIVNKILEL